MTGRVLPVLLVAAATVGLLCGVHQVAFAVAPPHGRSASPVRGLRSGLIQHATIPPSSRESAGLAAGFIGSLSIIATVFAHSRRQHSRIAARVASGAPSLIQILEQKKLLSTVEKSGLLQQAEVAGLGIETVEQLGLLKLAQDLKLLSTAETLATSPSTPLLLALGSGALAAAAYFDVTLPSFGFLQWVIAGALGAPALVLFVAFLALVFITGGARRTQDIDLDDTVVTYKTAGGANGVFTTKKQRTSFTLLDVLEKKGLLAYLEENRLLSLAASVVQRPLTLTQNLGVLSQLESRGLLSQVEASATDSLGAAKFGLVGLTLLLASLFVALGNPLVGALLAVPGLALIAVGVGFGVIQAPLGGA